MSHVVSMRLKDEQLARLQRYARTLSKTPGEVSAMFVEEQLREAEFAFVEFRASPLGRQAYMKGSRLTVWWVIHTAKSCGMSAEQLASHFHRPLAWAQAALNYYEAFPREIDQAIDDHEHIDFEALRRSVPAAQMMDVFIRDAE